MKHLGIDIGTTTICGAVLSADGSFVEAITEPNSAALVTDRTFERLQDPNVIIATVFSIANRLIDRYPDIVSIGLTGQMHGILYLDGNGKCVSPLYTWQDARGELDCTESESYAASASRLTASRMASGYGLVTHFYNIMNRLLPAEAVTFCTIADYAVMQLSALDRPILHASNAASVGCFDLQTLEFDHTAAEKLSIAHGFMPVVTSQAIIAGSYRNIPVCVAIGDNQASFIGSGADDHSILINVGTGSQISLVSDYVETEGSIELRPFIGNRYLLVGSSLSGGRAYALLERFFRSVALMADVKIDSMYPFMEKALEHSDGAVLHVSTLFDGSRDDPSARGSITDIGIDNFTPVALIRGFISGIADELYTMYRKMGAPEKSALIGSGNGLRKNRSLCNAFEMRFAQPLTLSSYHEEAACGAALFSRDALGL